MQNILTFCYNLEVVLEIRFNIIWNIYWVSTIFWLNQTVFDQLWYMLIDTMPCCNIFTVYIYKVCSSILYRCPSYQSRLWVWNNLYCYVESTIFVFYCNWSIWNNGTSWMTLNKILIKTVIHLIEILMLHFIY